MCTGDVLGHLTLGKALLARQGPLFSEGIIPSHGKVYTFGFGKHGQVRISTQTDSATCASVRACVAIAHGRRHNQLGHGTLTQSAEPTIVPTLIGAQIVQVACSGAKTFALTARTNAQPLITRCQHNTH
jgi:hypothetical protein